ncbi:tetratricopeptide repeat protein [Pseudomonadota bacterium]
MNKNFTWLLLAVFLHTSSVIAADILKTDSYFTAQQYDQARIGYIEAAALGNPHAYYQLARIYAKGLGVEKDMINALIYYSLAAEYDYFDAQKVINETLSRLPQESQTAFLAIMSDYKSKHGKQVIDAQYFPFLKQDTLNEKVTFEGKAELERVFYSEDFVDDSIASLNNSAIDEGEEYDGYYMSTPKEPYLILDIDIAPDGSIRQYAEVQKLGAPAQRLINEYILFPQPKPTFKNDHIGFVHRVFLGAAGYSKSALVTENKPMYDQIRYLSRQLKQGTTLSEQYQYAMALLNFPWLPQEKGEAEQKLLQLSQIGHPGAMYEYGLLLYRQQRDIPSAIHWISQASKYGLTRAEYRLGMILTTSPWVQPDEAKALFWFSSAMEKGHIEAAIRSIDIKLNAKDKSLRDVESAIQDLHTLQTTHQNNPEYYYLLALSYRDRPARDFSLFVSNIRTAINRGNSANWDTSEWQDLLERSTVGTVYITDQ